MADKKSQQKKTKNTKNLKDSLIKSSFDELTDEEFLIGSVDRLGDNRPLSAEKLLKVQPETTRDLTTLLRGKTDVATSDAENQKLKKPTKADIQNRINVSRKEPIGPMGAIGEGDKPLLEKYWNAPTQVKKPQEGKAVFRDKPALSKDYVDDLTRGLETGAYKFDDAGNLLKKMATSRGGKYGLALTAATAVVVLGKKAYDRLTGKEEEPTEPVEPKKDIGLTYTRESTEETTSETKPDTTEKPSFGRVEEKPLPPSELLTNLNKRLADNEELLAKTKIPTKKILQSDYDRLKEARTGRTEMLQWAQLANEFVNAITKFAAAKEGLRTGLNLSKVETAKIDWDKKIDQAYKQYEMDYNNLVKKEDREDTDIAQAEKRKENLREEIRDLRQLIAQTKDSRVKEQARQREWVATHNLRAAVAEARVEEDKAKKEERRRKEEERKNKTYKPSKDEEQALIYLNNPDAFNEMRESDKKALLRKYGPYFAEQGYEVTDAWPWEAGGLSGLILRKKEGTEAPTRQLSEEDKKALKFVQDHPDHPYAEAIRKSLGM